MTRSSNRTFLRHVRVLYNQGTFAGLTDGQLLERFAGRSGEAAELAFSALVERHGPMVLRVCRRILSDAHDAEDAFQAVFLVLVRRADSVRSRESVASWLHGVALRVAGAARLAESRRQVLERKAAERMTVAVEGQRGSDELGSVLHDEIGRMPDRYRAAFVLCYLEGRTYDEAAQVLACPVGTIKSRLATARETLRARLTRRGFIPMAGTFTAVLAAETATAAVPCGLAEVTVRGALKIGTEDVALAGTVSAAVAALTEGAVGMMAWTRLRLAAALMFAVGFGGAGAAVVAQQSARSGETPVHRAVVDSSIREAPPARGLQTDHLMPESTRGDDLSRLTIEQKLNEKISVTFENTTLKDAVEILSERTGLSIMLDRKALAELGLAAETRINLVASNLKLRTAIKLMLRPLKCRFVVHDGIVLITGPRVGEMQTVTYYVGDLLPCPATDSEVDLLPDPPALGVRNQTISRPAVDMGPLIDLLTSSVAPGTWRVYNPNRREASSVASIGQEPTGSMTPFFLSISLVIRHTADVHDEIADRLRQLRLVRDGDKFEQGHRPGAAPTPEGPRAETPGAAARDTAGSQKLDGPTLRSRNNQEIVTRVAEMPGVAARDTPGPRTVYVPTLSSGNLTPQETRRLSDAVRQALEHATPVKVVENPDDADYILQWSLLLRSKPKQKSQ
ncbi:MAG: RNA polymerase sigma factor [Isosphaeraceae bacterium]|nr:RNA polymerase sigma factor [Isosphaeraceae bacterium]